jgi:hypothetical protein
MFSMRGMTASSHFLTVFGPCDLRGAPVCIENADGP